VESAPRPSEAKAYDQKATKERASDHLKPVGAHSAEARRAETVGAD
jgi:hypothetical protein